MINIKIQKDDSGGDEKPVGMRVRHEEGKEGVEWEANLLVNRGGEKADTLNAPFTIRHSPGHSKVDDRLFRVTNNVRFDLQ